jgi:glutaredoxin
MHSLSIFLTHTHTQVKKKQTQIEQILQSKKIAHQTRDIATNEAFRAAMRTSGQTAPPQLFRDDTYLGVRTPTHAHHAWRER